MDRAGVGARRWPDASGGGAAFGSAQELGVPPAGALGEAERRGEGGFAPGFAGSGVGAAVGAVAGGQPGSGAGVDAAADAHGPGSERRDRPVARSQPGAGGIRAGSAAGGVGTDPESAGGVA